MHTAYCPDCKKFEKFKLLLDISLVEDTKVAVLSACKQCHKGIWVEMTFEQYRKEVSEYEDKKRGR